MEEQLFERQPTRMEIIREGLFKEHPAGEKDKFAEAILDLFREYTKDYYKEEWERIDDNERIYHGNHWEGQRPEKFGDPRQAGMPKPAMPIITSAIENLKADLSDGFPEACIEPDDIGNRVLAKVLQKVISEELDSCEFERQYDRMTHDVLNCGWGVWEVGYDPDACNGRGGAYIRHIVNKNFMCDPQTPVLQDGRAVFKFDRKPADWFAQHYPEQYKFFEGDDDLINDNHDDFEATTAPSDHHDFRLIEAWFRVYDPKTRKNAVHFVKIAGGQVLENSALSRPKGYYPHGMYPFVICTLYPQKGSALGIGVTDLFKESQRYSDKLDQILMVNAFRASRPRIFTQKGLVDYDDVRDFSKEVIETEGNPANAIQWQQPQPLPSYVLEYINNIRAMIKQESGTNDQSRGQTGSGVTAASAITALQEMSTKRSRMEERRLHEAFRSAVKLMVETLSAFSVYERPITVTISGNVITVPFSKEFLSAKYNENLPLDHCITIRSARQTKYAKMTHNELMLQMMQMLGGSVDPVIMMEGLDYDGLEPLLDNVRRAQQGGMIALQKQVEQLTAQLQEMQENYQASEDALSEANKMIGAQQRYNAIAQGAQDMSEAETSDMAENFAM